jgi:transcriptional regulator with XRE-family HTH domain
MLKSIKKFLDDRGWTQRVLAERAEIGEDTLSKLLSGKRIGTLQVLKRLSKVTGIPLDTLAKESVEEKP